MVPVLVELAMLRIVLDRMLDFDLHRADILDLDPLRYLIEEELAEELGAVLDEDDPRELFRRHAIARALDLLQRIDPDELDDDPDIPSGPGAANDE